MAAPRLRSLPRNVTDVTRVLACVDGSVQNLQVSSDVGSVQLEHTTPIREFFSWPGKRNYEGLYWSSTNRRHVEFESLLEREYLLAADNASDIVAIAAQPLALLWPRDTRQPRPRSRLLRSTCQRRRSLGRRTLGKKEPRSTPSSPP